MSALRIAGWLLATLAACGCGSRIPSSYPSPASVQLGTGGTSFVAIHDGDAVPIIMGPQGGYHVWGSVQAIDLDPMGVRLEFSLVPNGATMPFTVRVDTVDLQGTTDGLELGTHVGTTVFLPDPNAVRGVPCHFHVQATDMEGRTATDEHVIVPM